MDSSWKAVHEVAARHAGAVTASMAVDCGVARSTFHDRRRRERWRNPFRGVWLLPAVATTSTTWWHAALLVVDGPLVALSHATAAHQHDLCAPGAPIRPVHLLVPHEQKVQRTSDLVVHRSRVVDASDVVMAGGMPTTSPSRTILDMAAVSSADRVVGMVLAARQRGLVTPSDLWRQLRRRPNVKGARILRVALGEVGMEATVDSILELRTRQLLEDHGYAPLAQHPVACADGRVVHLDLAFPAARFAIECDGRQWHGSDAFERDRRRWRAIQHAGWDLTWVTWSSLRDQPMALIDEVARRVALAGA